MVPLNRVVVREISGVVPNETIDGLLRTMGVEPGEGVNPALIRGGFEGVRNAVVLIGKEGWSAGQVLEQVCHHTVCVSVLMIPHRYMTL